MGTSVLLVLSENYDDMAFLSCQVILEENGHDVIISSKDRGTIKGETSSVIAVSLNTALDQQIDYSALILILSENAEIYNELIDTIKLFNSNSKFIVSVFSSIKALELADISINSDNELNEKNKIILLQDLNKTEEFFEYIAKKIS